MYKIIDKNNFKISNELYEGEVKIKESFFYPLTKSEKKLVSTNSNDEVFNFIIRKM